MTGRHSAPGWSAWDQEAESGGFTWRSRRFVLPALILFALVAGTLAIMAARATGQGCAARETVDVVAAPDIAPVLDKAGAAWADMPGDDGVCITVHVTSRSSADAVEQLAQSDAAPPDVWVPDSSEWVQKLRRDTAGEATPAQSLWVSPPMATSPLVLAASSDDARSLVGPAAGGWSRVLSGATRLTVADPTTSTVGLLTVAAAQATLGSPSGSPTRPLVSSLVELSTDVVAGTSPSLRESPSQPVPASEQAVIRANAGTGPATVQAVYPRGAGPSLDFPVVEFAPPERAPQHGDAVGAYVRSLYQAAAQTALRQFGLRDARGSAFPSTVDFEGIAPTAVIPPSPLSSDSQMTAALRVWSAAQRRNRTLVVVDVSGSMIGEKIRFASSAAKAALRYLPDDAKLGLWAFSTDLDGSIPWRRLVSLGKLGPASDPESRRQALREASGELPALAARHGNTALYRTTWAAFRDVRARYDARRYNSVVLLTDGSNTAAGLSRKDLLSRLRDVRSPDRPLPIFTVAIGPDADRDTLQRIAAATGGTESTVDSVDDMLEIFLEAVIKEGS